jgi:hypothetical protein
VKPFSARIKDAGEGKSLLGLGLSAEEVAQLQAGQALVVDLSSCGVGLWSKDGDARAFSQPRDSKVVLILGDTKEAIGKFLRVELP